ncbi:efflux RND transporter periplasmic adaptor subunit [Tepidimonas charontis]|uniref:efflux RND transporter periplasmic adaptor subunit n=1 Tax=Tepidimonas charontis TaxID=2267262 RepID=UPI00137590E6|nr:efflux RND transporter periplasmic adaptor subunit [Tepidimonas charontis]
MAAAALVAAAALAWWWQRAAPVGVARGPAAAAPAPGADAGTPAARADSTGTGGSAAPGSGGRGPGGPGAAVAVEVQPVQLGPLVEEAQAVGTLRARQSVVLRPEIAARVVAIGFADGARVRRGQLLFQLDDALPRAELAQAEAQLAVQQANLRRTEELVAQGFVAQRTLDEARAAVAVAQAQVELARARLQRTRLTAPFDGVAGIRRVDAGEYVRDGAELVRLDDLGELLLDFRLPERLQARVQPGQMVRVRVDGWPERELSARVQAIDPVIDPDGRALAVRARLLSPPASLKPGMFARVTVELARVEQAIRVPEEAVVPQGQQFWVWRLDPAAATPQAQRVAVQLGLRRDGWVQVTHGLQPGDRVVVAGHQRLQRDGSAVRIVEPQRSGSGAPPAASAVDGSGRRPNNP